MQLFFVFLLAIFLSMVLVAIFMRWAPVIGLIDQPNARKVHKSAIPRVGGIGMLLGTLACISLWLDWTKDISVFMVGIGVIGIFGVWDDRHDLGYKTKFGGQIIAAVFVVAFTDICIRGITLFWFEVLFPNYLSYPITVLFLLGTTNAVNLSDGLDGLAGGLSLLSLVAMAFLANLVDQTEILSVIVIIMGSILGFLRYNTHPALVFMGDTGSQFLGFALGVLSLRLTQSGDFPFSPMLPLLILGLPIVDTVIVMINRLREGRSPFKPDKTHFHHKLMSIGFDHYESVVIVYAIQLVFILSAYVFRYESDIVVLGLYSLYFMIVVFTPATLSWMLSDKRRAEGSRVSFLTEAINRGFRKASTLKSPTILLARLIPLFLVTSSLICAPASMDMAVLSFGLLVAISTGAWYTNVLGVWGERIAIYCCAILVVYLSELPAAGDVPQLVLRGYLVILGVIIAMAIRFGGRDLFELTPSDFLVIFVLVAAANLPVFDGVNYAAIAVETAVVLYGVEYVLRRPRRVPTELRWGAAIALVIIGVRGLFGFSIVS